MVCPTPVIEVSRVSRRRKRQASTSINARDNIEAVISFVLDGVQEYRDLTTGNLTEYSRLTVYADPVIEPFSSSVLTFTSTWPVKERSLKIKVKCCLLIRDTTIICQRG